MKHFLDLIGLTQFLAKLKETFIGNIKTDKTDYSAASGTITFEKKDSNGNVVETTVAVKNVVTTDTEQTISGNKTFTGAVKVPDITDGATDTGLAANKGYVDSKITENDAMKYRGAVVPDHKSGDQQILPLTTDGKSDKTVEYKIGSTFKAAVTTGSVVPGSDPEATYGNYIIVEGQTGIAAKAGDLFIVSALTTTQTGSGTKTYTITYDYIPAADDVTSVQYSADGTGINIGTSATYGQAIFGEAAIKPVDTSISAGSTSTNVPTSAAVANYALKEVKNATNDSSLTIGTKASGEQTLAVKVKANSGITSDSNGLSANVNANSGLSINSSTGAIELTTPGNGIEVDSTNHNIKAKANTSQGIEVTSDGIGIALYMGSGEEPVSSSGLEFDSTDGKLRVKTGSGLTINDGALDVDVEQLVGSGLTTYDGNINISAGSGLDFSGNNLVVDPEGFAGSGLAAGSGLLNINLKILEEGINKYNISGLIIDNKNALQVNAGNGITVDANGVAVNVDSTNANGLSVGANGLAMAKGSTSTLGTVKVTNGNGLSIDNTGTISMATAVASTSGTGGTAGAMSATDKEKLDNLGASTTVGKNGITVTKTGNETDIAADINTTKGLAFTGDTEGSKKIGVNVLTNSGLDFTNNGELYIEPITEAEINNLFNPQQQAG